MLEPGAGPRPVLVPAGLQAASPPCVSCLMVTRGDVFPARLAIECFLAQTYPVRELVIVCSGPDGAGLRAVVDALADPRVRLVDAAAAPLGALRNRAVRESRGELLCVWDDDDLHHPRRIEDQVAALLATGAAAVFLPRLWVWWPQRRRLAVSERRPWEGSMIARRERLIAYPEIARAEDTPVLEALLAAHPVVLAAPGRQYCYVVHGANTSPDDHFDALARRALRRFEGAEYVRALALLAQSMPVRSYQIGLQARTGGSASPR